MSSRKGNYVSNDLIDLCAYIVLVISGGLLLVTFILNQVGGDLGKIVNVLNFIRDIAFVVGIGFASYRFTRGRHIVIKVIYWIALIAFIVFAILGFAM